MVGGILKQETFSYQMEKGWSVETFPDLDSDNTLVMVFAAPEFRNEQGVFQSLYDAYPNSKVIGCSTAGEIHNDMLLDNSLSVAVIKFEGTSLRSASCSVADSSNTFESCIEMAESLNEPSLSSVFILSDGLHVNGSELVRAFTSALDVGVIVTGGLAADGPNFNQTFVLLNGSFEQGTIAAIGFYGDKIRVRQASKGGWDNFGHERIVTRSSGNVLYELDGKPALEIYKQYLGDRVDELPSSALLFPLSVKCEGDKTLIRTILAVDEENQSMIFAGDIPQGATTQFLYANFDRVIEGAAQAGEVASHPDDNNVIVIGISCVGRRLILGDRTDEELEATLEAFPKSTSMVGYYSYGELSTDGFGTCDLHNQSMTLTTISEAA